MLKQILVPLDGSPRAERAIPVAARIARASQATLVLVQVIDLARDLSWQVAASPFNLSDALDAEYRGANNYLHELKVSEALRDLHVRIIVTTGRASQTILALAQPEKIDLIVMSSHGYTGFKRLVLGSVTQQIERHSEVPVLILRDQAALAGEHLGDTRPVRVIAALDGSAYAETILPAAVELSKTLSSPETGMLHLAMVIPEKGQGTDRTNDEYNKVIQEAQNYLTRLSQNLRREQTQITVTTSISVQSNVRDTLIELAERGSQMEGVGAFTGYDLIAMTTHGREGIERMLHTSVAEQVLDAAKVPLLIIHSAQALDAEQPVSEMEIFAGPIGLL